MADLGTVIDHSYLKNLSHRALILKLLLSNIATWGEESRLVYSVWACVTDVSKSTVKVNLGLRCYIALPSAQSKQM